MPLIPGISPVGLIKPPMWAVSAALASPEWKWFWDGSAEFLTACWEGNGQARDLISGEVATRTEGSSGPGLGESVWEGSKRGLARRHQGQSGTNNFDGIAEKFTNLTSIASPGTGGFTVVTVLIPLGTNATANTLIAKGNAPSAAQIVLMRNTTSTNDEKVRFQIRDGAGNDDLESTGAEFSPGVPALVIGRRGSKDATELFFNGRSVDSGFSTRNVDNSEPLALGQFSNNATYANQQLLWAGYWGKTWTDEQVAQLARDPFGPFRMALDTFSPPPAPPVLPPVAW